MSREMLRPIQRLNPITSKATTSERGAIRLPDYSNIGSSGSLPKTNKFSFSSLFPGLVNMLGDFGSSALNYFLTKKTNEDSFQKNKELSDRAFEQNLRLMREQNAYNSEAAQALRMRAAGLDPNAGQITSHASADASPLEYPTYDPQVPQFDVSGPVGTAFQSYRDMENLRLSKITTAAQAAEMMSQVDKNGASAWLDRQLARFKGQEADILAATTEAVISSKKYESYVKRMEAAFSEDISRQSLRNLYKDGEIKAGILKMQPEEFNKLVSEINFNNTNKDYIQKQVDTFAERLGIEKKKAKALVQQVWLQFTVGLLNSGVDIAQMFLSAKGGKSFPMPNIEKPFSSGHQTSVPESNYIPYDDIVSALGELLNQ